MPHYGEWETYSDELDPLTRVREVRIHLAGPSDTFLGVGCIDKRLQIYVSWGAYITAESTTRIWHRLDDRAIKALPWTISTSGWATFFPRRGVPDLIRELYNSDEFVVEVVPDRSDPITIVFEPVGLYWAVKPVLEACEVEID